MKRVLAWALLLVMVLGMFAGCKNTEDPTPTTNPGTTAPQQSGIKGPGAQDAIDYLKSLYQDDGTETPVDYKRYGIVRVGGIEFNIAWTVDVAEDLVKVVVNEDGTVTIDINEQCEEATPYVLTATITDENGNVATHSWNHILPKAQDMVEIVKAAYALANGESLPYQSRLIGKIISIDTIWSDEFQNISVTIEIEGAEGMPIQCYRLKGNENTIAQIPDLKVGNIITVVGTLKNYEGKIEFDAGCILEKVEKGDAVEAPTDPGEILKAAYALKKDEVLPYQATLTGTVTKIDAPYDPNYGNISVVIEVEGYPQYPMLCYRLKGTGVDEIAVDDLITVTGIIKNYNGKIEFDAGCMMTERVSGGGVAQKPSSDAAKILADAAKLGVGDKLPYIATLTGEIYSVDNAYDPGYGNVTVTIKVNGVKIQCYRMVGDGIDQIRETDTITVTGTIENYNGKLEFSARCNLDSWTKGPRNVNYGPVKEDVAYRLYIDQKGIDKTVYFDGTVSSNRLQTTTTGSKGADVYAERISGKGLRFFYMDGQTKTYIEIEEFTNDKGQQRGGVKVTTSPSCYWVYNSDYGVYIVNLPTAGKYLLGTYGTYDTVSASWLGYIDGSVASSSAQYVAKFIEASKVQDEEPSVSGSGVLVSEIQAGVPYKWGIEQKNKGVNIYFNGGMMNTYYGGTTENINEGVDVVLEATNGGYYISFTDANGAKKYINVVVNGTHRNFTIANTASTVYTYSTEHKTLITNVDGTDCYIGTYDSHNTFSVSTIDKISNSFPSHFYTVGEGVEPEPSEPTEPAGPSETIPVVTDTLENGDQVVIYAPAYNKALSADKVNATSYYNKGVDITVADGEINGYGNAEIWTVVKNADGTYSFANGGQNIGLAEEFSSMSLGAIYDDWTLISLGNGLYNIKNVGRGNFIEWYDSKGNWSTYNSSSAATDGQFQLSFYVIGEGILGDETVEPEVTEPEVTEPGTSVPDIYSFVIVAEDASVAMTTVTQDKTYGYLPKTDVTVVDGVLSGIDVDNVFYMVSLEETDDYAIVYIVDYYGRVLYMTDNFNSCNLATEIPAEGAEWKLTMTEDGRVYITNILKNKTVGYDSGYGSFGVYPDASKHTALLLVPVEIVEEDPDVTEPEATEPSAGSSATYTFSDYGQGVQYADESYELDDVVSLDITDCHMNTQLRIYQDANNGYDGMAFFASEKAIHSVVINVGYRNGTLNVLGSSDGINYTIITQLSVTSSYTEYTVEIPAGTNYKYLMLDAVETQLRVPYITFNFAE